MDWLFLDDNYISLLCTLAEGSNQSILTARQIKTTVQFVWPYFQRAILIKIFLPYVLYLYLIMHISSTLSTDFNEHLYKDLTKAENLETFNSVKRKSFAATGITTFLMICFVYLESL